MKEEDAYRWFMRARWPSTKGVPCCPTCGVIGSYAIRRRRFRCKEDACRKEFSVTSGTILHSRKLDFRTLVIAFALSAHSAKGLAALLAKREMAVAYSTAFVLLHKLREAVAAERRDIKLDGTVEMDAMFVGGHVRPANAKVDRVDRRLAENQSGKRMAVMAMRERSIKSRTLAAAVLGEQADIAWKLVRDHADRTAVLRADQHPAYDELVGLNPLVRNDHGTAFVVEPGASTNQVESFFSRVRRAEIGVHHRISGKYLDWYAADLAAREDRSRVDSRTHAKAMLALALAHPVSRDMCGYWQRKNKKSRQLVAWSPVEPPP